MKEGQRVQDKNNGKRGAVIAVSGAWGHVVEVAWDDGTKTKTSEGELLKEPTR